MYCVACGAIRFAYCHTNCYAPCGLPIILKRKYQCYWRWKMRINKTLFCFFIAALCIGVAAYFEFIHYKIIPIYPPLSWGVVGQTISIILTIIFPWNGWVFLLPLLLAAFLKLGIRTISYLWIGSFFVMGILDTVISFDVISFSRLVKGVLHYLILYGCFYLPAALIKSFAQEKKA